MQSSDIALILPLLLRHQWMDVDRTEIETDSSRKREREDSHRDFFSLSKLFPFVPFSFSRFENRYRGERNQSREKRTPSSNTRHDVKSSTINPRRGLLVSRTTDTQRCIENEKRKKKGGSESIFSPFLLLHLFLTYRSSIIR